VALTEAVVERVLVGETDVVGELELLERVAV
jgi:hypothetical protein